MNAKTPSEHTRTNLKAVTEMAALATTSRELTSIVLLQAVLPEDINVLLVCLF